MKTFGIPALVAAATCLTLLAVATTGCELMVQLDRSFVDAGEAGCNICSDGNFGEGGAEEGGVMEDGGDAGRDATPDSASTDAPADATGDASAETSPSDAPAGG
jgi:hypothetical protein